MLYNFTKTLLLNLQYRLGRLGTKQEKYIESIGVDIQRRFGRNQTNQQQQAREIRDARNKVLQEQRDIAKFYKKKLARFSKPKTRKAQIKAYLEIK